MIKKTLITLFTVLFLVSGCAPYSMNQGAVGSSQEYRTVYGTVRSMMPIKINSQTGTGIGAITGAILGGVLGSVVGGGTGRVVATTVGAAGGAIAGGAIGNKVGGHNAYEIMVQADNGNTISIIEHASIEIHVGQRVRLLLGSKYSRIEPL